MIEFVGRQLADLHGKITRMAATLVSVGTVETVDASAGTVRIRMLMTDDDGTRLLSPPMPWLQRSTEHRPPNAGDHALVFDPSIGRGGALALCGWVSTARPAVDGGGAAHTLYSGPAQVRVQSADVRIGQNPADRAANARLVDLEIGRIWNVLTTWTPVAMDGGAALKGLVTPAATAVQSVAAQHVRVS